MIKNRKNREKEFDSPALAIEKVADANTVIGKSIITVSGSEVIPLSSVTVVNLSGGGEYGDVKTFREADGFQLAGGNGNPRGFSLMTERDADCLKWRRAPSIR